MIPRNPSLRAIGVAVSLVVADSLSAQSPQVLGQHNAAFLEGLWRFGYLDYADAIGKLVAASDLPDPEKQAVAASHTKLRIAIAANSGDADQRRQLVLQMIQDRTRTLQAATPDSEAGVDAVSELVDAYRLLADAVAETLAKEPDPAAQSKIREEADQMFLTAEKDIAERKQRAEGLRSEDKPGSELPMLVTLYGHGRLLYYHSLIFAADSHSSQRLVEDSLTILEDFDLEFGDSLAAFEAKLTAALCHARKGEKDGALGSCDDAIALRTRFDHDKAGVYQVDRNAADVIAAAVLQKTMFLADDKEFAKIVETTKDYLTTIPRALEANQGLAVLAAQGRAQQELGDNEGATATAQKLIELDPKGQWGYRGQEILSQLISGGSGKGIDTGRTLRIAESLAGQGEFEQALRMCREAILRARIPEDAAFAAEALLITGAIQASRGWFHEASVAFDAVARRFPQTPSAPDAVWRSIQCFIELDDSDGLPLYKRMIEERSQQLVKNYPDDPHVGQLQLIEAKRLEKAQKFLEAAAVYARITSESSVHIDARYFENNCYQRHARKLAGDGKAKEATEFEAKAADGFRKLIENAAATKQATTDAKAKAHLDVVDFSTRVALANMLLGANDTKKVDEAEQLLAKVELKDTDDQAPLLWALRIRITLARGNTEAAATDMDNALAKAPDARALLAVCRNIASALDSGATERFKQKDRIAATTQWKRAIPYYVRSAGGATTAEVSQIADRLLAIGMLVNELPDKVESWFEVPELKIRGAEPWEGALAIYSRLPDNGVTYKTRIGHARTLGFLGKTAEAEAELTKLFTENKLAAANRRLDSALLAKRPELLTAYLEYGFAMRSPGGDEKARRARASDVFDRVCSSVPSDSRYWWFARYGQIETMVERGLYDEADVSLSSLERNNPDFDGDRFQLKRRFTALKTTISQKVPRKK